MDSAVLIHQQHSPQSSHCRTLGSLITEPHRVLPSLVLRSERSIPSNPGHHRHPWTSDSPTTPHNTASMAGVNEKPTFGASIIQKEPQSTTLLRPQPSHLPPNNPSFDSISPCSSNAEQYPSTKEEDDYDPISLNPYSAFYSHPRTRTSFAQAKSESKINVAIYSHDLESGSRITHTSMVDDADPKPPIHAHKDDKVWPCSKTKEKTLLARQRAKGCSPFSRLSKKQKFWVQMLIALIVIGAITGLAVGISKAVGGGVFKSSSNSNAPIPST